MTNAQIANIFSYHKPLPGQSDRYERIRAKARELAELLEAECPESREKSTAFTNLQQTVMWANAAIAIHEKPVPIVSIPALPGAI